MTIRFLWVAFVYILGLIAASAAVFFIGFILYAIVGTCVAIVQAM